MLGCDLDESNCTDVTNGEVDVITLRSHVDMGADPDEVVSYTMTSEKTVLDSSASQSLSLFYSQSNVVLDDHPWKISDMFKVVKPFFE